MLNGNRAPEMSSMPLNKSFDIWNVFVAAGLQERRNKRKLPGYDQELVRELNHQLFPGSVRNFSANLRRKQPTVEAFFKAFLQVLKPFSMMTRDVLTMFERAGARRSDRNLKIEFNFDEELPPLQHFREQAEIVRRVLRDAGELERGALSDNPRKGLEGPTQEGQTEVGLERDLRDLLNLPIWKRRHELYAVWVGSRIADALRRPRADGLRKARLVWHPDGDTLRFPFSGAQLASAEVAKRRFEFWTEKKTPLSPSGVSGRRNIQPDYRLDEMPVHRLKATRFVVECKQYLKWSIKNFGEALADYAAGCPEAVIVLVNYGPVPNDGDLLLRHIPYGDRIRTHAIGCYRPDNDEALEMLDKLIGANILA
jgi:hypothetical protein